VGFLLCGDHGSFGGRFARSMLSIQGNSCFKASRYKNSSALKA
jgi:hypothetical protein